MSFELSLIIVISLVAVVLGLVTYHLVGRVHLLERAVQGGLTPPTTRLSREQFERRFRTAHARSQLAAEIECGVLLVVGAEHRGSELDATLAHLPRRDEITVRGVDTVDAEALGVTTTPYLFVIDEARVRGAQPVAGAASIIDALRSLS